VKKILLLALVGFGVWNYYINNIKTNNATTYSTPASLDNSRSSLLARTQPQHQCDGREYCSQMHSYEEAKYFIENCPNTKMDGDGDGIPCERQFGR
jgi:hypothetical protein